MPKDKGDDLDRLVEFEGLLGHTFKERHLLVEALTHASYAAGNRRHSVSLDYERLEFLGDRVLGLVIADLLVRRFPGEKEGGLAPRLNALVRKDALAKTAQKIGLDRFIRLGHGESKAVVGRSRKAIIADACEAVIGAIYLDGGLAPAQAFIEKYWSDVLDNLDEVPRDAKTALQEWAQARGLAPPTYELISRTGPDHAPMFLMKATIDGYPHAEAQGASKRSAEQAAAESLLRETGIWPRDVSDSAGHGGTS